MLAAVAPRGRQALLAPAAALGPRALPEPRCLDRAGAQLLARRFGRGGSGGGGTTDGPFRHLKPRFTEKKKHFNEVLVLADRVKLLETAQDVLNEPERQFPRPFWEVMAKRCIQSMHLFRPLELAIVTRMFDVHQPGIRSGLDVYGHAATQAQEASGIPGHALLVLSDVFPRRLKSPAKLRDVMAHLGREAADALWELSAAHAVRVLGAVGSAGVRDPALCGRVAAKLWAQLQAEPGALELEDLAGAAAALAAQEHRDVPLLRELAARTAQLCAASPAGAEAARGVLGSLAALGVEPAPEALQAAAAAAA
ncbi:unnamed protein product [Prorocentrum cordatum]|uniref:Protein-serine/threonine kinase n=1 Tax=Prorocentrum cordatum TaxID=2364126 RepID=A0ABN9WJH2_9DINO|nr:unnamed protein product [Polarella glacialis]